jgi:trehalose/maltose hydrolase-like predicted phosphorylase
VGYDDLLSEHTEAWNNIWESADIIIPGEENEQLQLATRASLFHLLSNIREGSEGHGLGDNSIAPAGLTSDSYAGEIFWDADTWMAPSLLTLFPSYAEVREKDFHIVELANSGDRASQTFDTGSSELR